METLCNTWKTSLCCCLLGSGACSLLFGCPVPHTLHRPRACHPEPPTLKLGEGLQCLTHKQTPPLPLDCRIAPRKENVFGLDSYFPLNLIFFLLLFLLLLIHFRAVHCTGLSPAVLVWTKLVALQALGVWHEVTSAHSALTQRRYLLPGQEPGFPAPGRGQRRNGREPRRAEAEAGAAGGRACLGEDLKRFQKPLSVASKQLPPYLTDLPGLLVSFFGLAARPGEQD